MPDGVRVYMFYSYTGDGMDVGHPHANRYVHVHSHRYISKLIHAQKTHTHLDIHTQMCTDTHTNTPIHTSVYTHTHTHKHM